MDFKLLKKLIGMVEKSAIDELEVEHNDLRVRIKKTGAQPITIPAQAASPIPAGQPQAKESTPAPPERQAQAPTFEDEDLEEIVSPMVGTFYAAASPGEAPYVSEGSEVKKGDILCLVEAMKLMNEIESPYDGKIVSIAVDNAQPVEYGERLFLIKPHNK